VHGSFLKGEFRDIDLAIYLFGKPTAKAALDMELTLEETLSSSLGYPFDVKVLNLSPFPSSLT